VIILPYAFSLIVLSVVRKTEIFCREPWGWVASVFLYGTTMAAFLALILNEGVAIFLSLWGLSPTLLLVISATVFAPIVEESVKSTGILWVRSRLTEVENGIIYGSAVGLGFSATENVLYFLSAYNIGVEALVSTILLRFLTSTFLHLGATGVTGYGIGLSNVQKLLGRKVNSWKPFLLAAMGLHAFFNFLSYIPLFFGQEIYTQLNIVVLLAEIALVWLLFTFLRRKIIKFDRTAGCALEVPAPPRTQPPIPGQ
jgi:RsiW-degrading membrane proteinase PrsW (M82 family)